MNWPDVKALADELELINANVEHECDVRLQVYQDGQWIIRSGDSQYDTDHRGWWGASSVPGWDEEEEWDPFETARDLLDQAQEQEAMSHD